MALVNRLFAHKQPKNSVSDLKPVEDKNEHQHQLAQISNSWKRFFPQKQEQQKDRWVLSLSGIIKAGDEGLFSSVLFDKLHAHPGGLSLESLYEVFAEELRSRPAAERSAYAAKISKFLSSTKRVGGNPKRIQSVSLRTATTRGRVDGSIKSQRMSLDLSATEWGLARGISIRKPIPPLVSISNGFPVEGKERAGKGSWMKDGKTMERRYGGTVIKVTPAELVALSVLLACPLNATKESSAQGGAFGISISTSIFEDGRFQVVLRKRSRTLSHIPPSGSGFSPLFAKHLVAGSLPFSQDEKTIKSILITNHTFKTFQSGSPLYLYDCNFKTPQSKFLSYSPGSNDLSFHIASAATQMQPTNPLIDAIAALPFVGGLTALASIPVIRAVRFAAAGGCSPARLLQRLEGLVDKVNRHAPQLNIFGPLYESQHAVLLYRERERLGQLATGAKTSDTLEDKVSRMRRYITLLERLMALVPDVKPQEVRAAVQRATKAEVERSYEKAVTAYQINPTLASAAMESRGCLASDSRNKRYSVQSHFSTHQSSRSSAASVDSNVSPASSDTFLESNLGKQMEQLLKAELPLCVEQVAFVARMILVAWTLSVGQVAWEQGEEGFRVPDMDKLPEKMLMC